MGCTKLVFREHFQEANNKIFSKEKSEERFETFLEEAKESSKYSIEYGRRMLKGLFNRFKISLSSNKIKFEKIKSNLKFVKPSESSLNDIEKDYGLKSYSENEIEIKIVDGDHLTILNNDELVNFINSNI